MSTVLLGAKENIFTMKCKMTDIKNFKLLQVFILHSIIVTLMIFLLHGLAFGMQLLGSYIL